MKSAMLLRIVSPEAAREPVECDSIRLHIADGARQNEAGFYGIRKNHAPALLLLDEGTVTAFKNGVKVFSCRISGGFARVARNEVTVAAKSPGGNFHYGVPGRRDARPSGVPGDQFRRLSPIRAILP